MVAHGGQTLNELLADMGITRRHYNRCVTENKIPYKGLVDWCLKNNVSLDEIMIEEK